MVIEITAFTDGSADNIKKNSGGIGVYFPKKEMCEKHVSKWYTGTNITNQRMELLACIEAIKSTRDNMVDMGVEWKLKIYSDSMYSINCVTQWAPKWILYGWRRKDKKGCAELSNKDLIIELYTLSKIYPVRFEHVNSHQKEPKNKRTKAWKTWCGNKMADKLANDSLKRHVRLTKIDN